MGFERRMGAGWAIHPGEILKNEFLVPMKMSEYALAQALDVNPQSINDIARKKRGISAEMAVRLGRYFQTSSEFWINLQSAYDLARATRALKKTINKIQPRERAA